MPNKLPPLNDLLPLVQAIKKATGQKVHLSTALRWCHRQKGAALNSYMVGGRRMTRAEDVEVFVQERTEETATKQDAEPPRPLSQRVRDVRRAEQQLEEALS